MPSEETKRDLRAAAAGLRYKLGQPDLAGDDPALRALAAERLREEMIATFPELDAYESAARDVAVGRLALDLAAEYHVPPDVLTKVRSPLGAGVEVLQGRDDVGLWPHSFGYQNALAILAALDGIIGSEG